MEASVNDEAGLTEEDGEDGRHDNGDEDANSTVEAVGESVQREHVVVVVTAAGKKKEL